MNERRYTPDHVWIAPDGRVGVTLTLVRGLPRIAALHLPEVGDVVRAAQPFAALEGDKGIVDVHAPCDGTVVELHADVATDPERLRDEHATLWLVRVEGTPGPLLDADAYAKIAGPLGPLPRR